MLDARCDVRLGQFFYLIMKCVCIEMRICGFALYLAAYADWVNWGSPTLGDV